MTTAVALEQSQFLKGKVRYELAPNGELKIHAKDRSGEREVSYALRDLSEKTTRTRQRTVGAWVGFSIIGGGYVALCVAIFVGLQTDPIISRILIAGFCGLIFFPFTLACFLKAMRESCDVTEFYSRWNGAMLFTIANDVPKPETAKEFIGTLTDAIRKASPIEVKGDGLVDQLAMLDQLRTKGVLTDAEFTAAKQRLLQMGAQEKKIGF